MSADLRQVSGSHYKDCPPEFQHWNLVIVHNWDYFQAQAIKYIMRYKNKNGAQDLKKALHFVEKMIEEAEDAEPLPVPGPIVVVPPDYYQYVKPTGWVGFTYEGGDSTGDLYTCSNCRTPVRTLRHQPPWDVHNALDCANENR